MVDCDFIPANYRDAQSLRGAIKLRGSLIGTMLVFMVIWVVAHQRQLQQANAMLANVTSESEQVAAHLEKKYAMQREREQLEQQQLLIHELGNRASAVVVLADVTRRMPDSVLLIGLKLNSPRFGDQTVASQTAEKADAPTAQTAIPPATPTPGAAKAPEIAFESEETTLVMTGLAIQTTDIIRFAAELERSPLMERVQMNLKGVAEWGGRVGQQFELVCQLRAQEIPS